MKQARRPLGRGAEAKNSAEVFFHIPSSVGHYATEKAGPRRFGRRQPASPQVRHLTLCSLACGTMLRAFFCAWAWLAADFAAAPGPGIIELRRTNFRRKSFAAVVAAPGKLSAWGGICHERSKRKTSAPAPCGAGRERRPPYGPGSSLRPGVGHGAIGEGFRGHRLPGPVCGGAPAVLGWTEGEPFSSRRSMAH